MANWKKLLSVLVAALMLFTMPITTGIARAVAEGTTEPAESGTPSESIELEVEEMDPAQLHVHKLGEVDEEEGDGFDPAELEITDLNKIVRASKNIPTVKDAYVNTLNVYDILNADKIVIEKDAMQKIQEVYA